MKIHVRSSIQIIDDLNESIKLIEEDTEFIKFLNKKLIHKKKKLVNKKLINYFNNL